jgi:hypothetical protein
MKDMKMDKSTYIFNGNTYGKGRLVLAVVEQYVSDNHGLAKKELEESFPSALQGSIGVISSIEEAEGKYEGKRHFVKNAIKLTNETVAVCNQWGSKNIDKFVQHAAGELGYNIDIEFEAEDESSTPSESFDIEWQNKAEEAEAETMDLIKQLTASHFEGDEGDEDDKSREEMLEAVKKDGSALEYADDTLKADREVVLEAVRNDGGSLEFASYTLKADREIVLEAVKSYGRALQYASDTLKNDRELVLAAVKNHGPALQFASDTLKADRELVLEVVKNSGRALQYASDTLKDDRELVLVAVKNHGPALKFASDTLKADRELVLEAVRNDGNALEYANDSFKADREIVLEALKSDSEEPLKLLYSIDNPSQEMLDIWLKKHGSLIECQHGAFEFDMEEVNEGQKIIIVFCAIISWIRNEKELKDETWNKAYSSIEALIFEGYNIESGIDDTGDDYFESAKKNGMLLANAYFLEGQEAAFRSFIKSVAISPTVFDLSSEEIGDLTLLLLLLCRFVEDNENNDVSQKYREDIESICRYQLDADEIYDETLEAANMQYSNSAD